MVSAAGLEPTTHSLGNCCSILMSYADNNKKLYPLEQKIKHNLILRVEHK